MHNKTRIVLAAVMLAAIIHPVACLSAVQAWTLWEQALTSTKPHPDSDNEVTLRVTYSGPNQERIAGLGFWDGDHTFKIRCLFPKPGTWTWKTECSDAEDPGLHHRSGTVEVELYSGSNPLYRHGYLRVSSNRHYLEHTDTTPFLWVGDTAWAAPMNARMEDWRTYVRDRHDKRFTGLQVFTASDWAGTQETEGHPPFLGEGLARPNPAYWQQYERKIQLANDEGLVVLIVGLMEPVKRYPDAASAQRFARHLVARLMGNFVIFSPSFDSPYMELGDGVGQVVRQSSALHLITQHPGNDLPAASQRYHPKPYLDGHEALGGVFRRIGLVAAGTPPRADSEPARRLDEADGAGEVRQRGFGRGVPAEQCHDHRRDVRVQRACGVALVQSRDRAIAGRTG